MTQGTGRIPYRPDIDGLRAVAVLLVLLAHVGLGFRGGYIGVDVFFVISGYLISGILLADLADGSFSLRRFYERRVRRIFPALAAVLLVTSALAWRNLTPVEAASYGRLQIAALCSVSNLFFWRGAGYFDDQGATKLLLHTWSLAVEEQFYVLFPILLLLCWRFARPHLRLTFAALTIASFAATLVAMRLSLQTAFYLAPLRGWELLLGLLLSLRVLPSPRTGIQRNIAGITGLLLILVPAVLYRPETHFPGWAALPPCAGATLIIAAGETGSSIAGALLSLRPLVFLGLISYSLYLWHWPLLVLQRTNDLFFQSTFTRKDKLLFCAGTIALSALSWALIEQPFRTGIFRRNRRALWLSSAVAFGCLLLASATAVRTGGFPGRFSPAAQQIAAWSALDRHSTYREGTCFLTGQSSFGDFRPEVCLASESGRPTLLLAGDSHAGQLYYGLTHAFPERSILQATASACKPFLERSSSPRPQCRKLFGYLFGEFLPKHPVDTLLLAAQWFPGDMDALSDTIRFAQQQGTRVVVFGPMIEYDLDLPRLLALDMRSGRISDVDRHRLREPEQLDRTMAQLARTRWHVGYISVYQDLCRPACPLYAGANVPLLHDSHHLTPPGSLLLAEAARARGELP